MRADTVKSAKRLQKAPYRYRPAPRHFYDKLFAEENAGKRAFSRQKSIRLVFKARKDGKNDKQQAYVGYLRKGQSRRLTLRERRMARFPQCARHDIIYSGGIFLLRSGASVRCESARYSDGMRCFARCARRHFRHLHEGIHRTFLS